MRVSWVREAGNSPTSWLGLHRVMIGILLVAFALLGLGFAAGYAAREFVSRKRRAEYLAYEPYLPQMRKGAGEAATDDAKRNPAGPFVKHQPPAASRPNVPVADPEGLDELLRRLEREVRAKRVPRP
jgi:hypothetical protein